MATPEDKVAQIIDLYYNHNLSKRYIAQFVLGSPTKESTVRDILRRYKQELVGQPRPYKENPVQSHTGAINAPKKEGPRILIFDIETAPMLSYHFGMWKQNIGLAQKIQNSFVLCWAAKWWGDETVMTGTVFDNAPEGSPLREDDYDCVEELAQLIDQADFVVAHNGKGFDIPVLKARMVRHNMLPLAPHKLVDTLKIAKKEFRFPSNSLDSIAQYLGCSRKLSHSGFQLWRDVVEGCAKAQGEMLDYNIQDVLVLEEVYEKLRAWDSRSPNAALFFNNTKKRCGCCGSESLTKVDKRALTSVSVFPTYRCNDCGKVMRSGSNQKTAEQRANVLRNVI